MNAILKLSPRELAEERERLFQEKRKDPLYVLEAMNMYHDWHVYYVAKDMLPCQDKIDEALWRLLESSGEFETAESEAAGRRELE